MNKGRIVLDYLKSLDGNEHRSYSYWEDHLTIEYLQYNDECDIFLKTCEKIFENYMNASKSNYVFDANKVEIVIYVENINEELLNSLNSITKFNL